MAKKTASKAAAPRPQASPKEKAARKLARSLKQKENVLSGATVYLSGPMDFVASRAEEKEFGWRNRVGQFLKRCGVAVYDPWNKPPVAGLAHYGKEDEFSTNKRNNWTFEDSKQGDRTRAELCAEFWPTLHIDLRMTDTADFLVAFCPTNIYSVGTVHEIVVAREQHKPVLFVSPPVEFSALRKLEQVTAEHAELRALLDSLAAEIPIKENPGGTPSLWYLPLIGSESFFDGFGFQQAEYLERFRSWREKSPLDERELIRPPSRPVLPFLEQLGKGMTVPKRWIHATGKYQDDDDWLLLAESLRK